jgi:hypothetical protein
MTKPIVTAVGRLLKPKGNEPRVYKVIAAHSDGTVKTVIDRPC